MRINLTLASDHFRALSPLPLFFLASHFLRRRRGATVSFISALTASSSSPAALLSAAAGYKVARWLLVFPRLFKLYVQLISPPSPVSPRGFPGVAGHKDRRGDFTLKIPRRIGDGRSSHSLVKGTRTLLSAERGA